MELMADGGLSQLANPASSRLFGRSVKAAE
jgi:hypothetical protein